MPDRADRFDQLTGAFDDPIAPSPAFAARLRSQALAELAESPHQIASTSNVRKEPIMLATVATPTAQPTRRLPQGTRTGKLLRPRWTRTTALINVAAILLLLVGIARFFAPERTAPDSTYRLPAIASQPSGSPVAPLPSLSGPASMWGANAGQTWMFTGKPPDRSNGALVPLVDGQRNSYVVSSVATNDTLYMSVAVKGGSGYVPHLTAYDRATGTKRWTVENVITNNLVTEGELVIGSGFDGSVARLVALSSVDGSVVWASSIKSPGDISVTSIVLVNGKLYAGESNGQVVILEPSTGKQIATLGMANPKPNGNGNPSRPLPGLIAIYNSSLFVTTSTGEVVAYDMNDNQRLWVFPIPHQLGEELASANLAVDQGTVVVQSSAGVERSEGLALSHKTITAVDAATGKQRWTTQVEFSDTNFAITHGQVIIGVPGTTSTQVRSFDLATGHSRWTTTIASSLVPPVPLALSAAGSDIYAVVPNQFLIILDQDGQLLSQTKLPHLLAPMSVWGSPQPAWIDGGSATVIGSDASVSIFHAPVPTATPPASQQATPTAASVAAQPGANPGQTNQYGVSVGTPKSMTTLGPIMSPDEVEGGIVGDGTLYRVRIPAAAATGKTWTVEAVSLADGTARTIFDDPRHNASSLLVQDDQLLVLSNPIIGTSTDTTLTAVDTHGRDTRWSLSLYDDTLGGNPILAADKLFVPIQHGRVLAVDLTTHKIAWTSYVSAPGNPAISLAADATAIYAASGYYVTALDPASGAISWQADLSSRIIGIRGMSAADGHLVLQGTQAVARTSTPVAGQTMNAGRVLAVSAQNHAIEWQYDAPDQISPPLIVAHGKVIIDQTQGGPFGDTVALDLTTGKVAWQLKGALPVFADRDQVIAQTTEIHAEPRTKPATPIAGPNRAVFVQPPPSARSITLLGINPTSGTTQWVQGESIGNGGPTAYLPFDGGMVISISDGRVLVLRDYEGSQVSRVNVGRPAARG